MLRTARTATCLWEAKRLVGQAAPPCLKVASHRLIRARHGQPAVGGCCGRCRRWQVRRCRWGATSKRSAYKAAVAACKGNGGRKCKVLLGYYNQCGAIAWGNSRLESFSAAQQQEAMDGAMKYCQAKTENCQIYIRWLQLPSACSVMPKRHVSDHHCDDAIAIIPPRPAPPRARACR